ncbi:MAG: hypothetical protein LBP85_00300 [Prevotellaceae bacterium]|nr:hypothetical protein [Prevotellaceae bacterium]
MKIIIKNTGLTPLSSASLRLLPASLAIRNDGQNQYASRLPMFSEKIRKITFVKVK